MNTGDVVADFELVDETGDPRTLSGLLADGPVVLFFYPAAMTGGCTAESCHFRDLAKEFADLGAQRVGISPDPVTKQAQFSLVNDLDFPLLSDPTGTVATLFGVRPETIHRRTRDTRRLLEQAGYSIAPADTPLTDLNDLYDLATTAGIAIPAQITTPS